MKATPGPANIRRQRRAARNWRLVLAVVLITAIIDPATQAAPDSQDDGPLPPTRSATGAGRWGRPQEKVLDAEQQDRIDELRAIGYLQGSRPTSASGVTIHDEAKVAKGFNLYCSGHAPEAVLVDMTGQVLHSWRFPFEEAFGPLAKPDSNAEWWRRVRLLKDGSLLAIFEGMGLIKIDKDSKLVWKSSLRAHHDLAIQPNGDIYVLTREAHLIPRLSETAPILEDFITVLARNGRPKLRLSLIEAFEKSRFRSFFDERKRRDGDVFHTNSISVLRGPVADRTPGFLRGNILISFNMMGIIAVVDPRRGELVWVRQTSPIGQHDPKILPSGTMLIFNNYVHGEASQVVEIQPRTNEVVWTYAGSAEHPFHSPQLGAAQRLWNGNTLITESDGGRAFEVTPEKEIVWEFYNPHRAGDDGQFIAALPEMQRLAPDFPLNWARGAQP